MQNATESLEKNKTQTFQQNSTIGTLCRRLHMSERFFRKIMKYFNSCNLDLEGRLTAQLFLYLLGGVQPVLPDRRQK